jgi:hypothetical protein
MAQIFPEIQTIQNLKVSPTTGEFKLLTFLAENLSDDFEVYFQPYLNGDNPDIIIMRKGSGVMIFEVKDWNLNNYELGNNKNWFLKNIQNNYEKQKIYESPLKQVKKYKENLFNLHIEDLLEKKIKNSKYFSIINCAVYFHNASKEQIEDFGDTDEYVDLFGFDNLTSENFINILSKRWMNKPSKLFDDNLYNSFKRFFQPPIHTLEQGIEIKYSSEQVKLIEKILPSQQKIRGIAGSGKTIVLAKKAVNAYKRNKKKILILTFNITLKNYIHDAISKIREEFEWKNFYITNYHQFINTQTNNVNLKFESLENYENENLFHGHEDKIEKYEAIFIDEIQDYKTEWIKVIKKYFLAKNGELIVFGDEKQNLYFNNSLEEDEESKMKVPNTTIKGNWNKLKESFRLSEKIADISTRFQKHFFTGKYEVDQIQVIKQSKLFPLAEENIKYYSFGLNTPVTQTVKQALEIIKGKNIHSNNICFLSSNIEILREIDFEIRKQSKEHTKTTFETKETFDQLNSKDSDYVKQEIDSIRQNKKFNFWMNAGTIKLSTVHSFKGWEIPTLFLIINKNDKNDELIYTAITRCRYNLFIFNIGNERYDNFFTANKDLLNN